MKLPSTLVFRTSDIGIDVEKVEKKYNATFVGDFCIKDRNGEYTTQTVAIFWQETPPVQGYSHYLGLLWRDDTLMITSGETAFDSPITALVASNGEIVYSRHRHDFRTSKDGSVTIDGGRDYVRIVGDYSVRAPQVRLTVVGPVIQVHSMDQPDSKDFHVNGVVPTPPIPYENKPL